MTVAACRFPAGGWCSLKKPFAGLLRLILAGTACIHLGACAASDDVESIEADAPSEPSASAFVVLPDTQFYACAFPEIFREQAQWIVDNVEAQRIGLVLHTGDVVDAAGNADQWTAASEALHLLDGKVPYLLVPGNHDLDASRNTLLNTHFGVPEMDQDAKPVFFEPDHIENAYVTVAIHDQPWLFLGLEFAPRDRVLVWAQEVLGEHSDLPAVVFTHAYLYSDGARYDRLSEPPQPYHPDGYQITPAEGIADGQDIWEALVETHDNVRLVLSGHVIPDGTARTRIIRRSGTVVHEVLTNFQTCELCPCAEVEGGGGYLRLFVVDPSGKRIRVTTYSPHLDRELSDEENEFDLDL